MRRGGVIVAIALSVVAVAPGAVALEIDVPAGATTSFPYPIETDELSTLTLPTVPSALDVTVEPASGGPGAWTAIIKVDAARAVPNTYFFDPVLLTDSGTVTLERVVVRVVASAAPTTTSSTPTTLGVITTASPEPTAATTTTAGDEVAVLGVTVTTDAVEALPADETTTGLRSATGLLFVVAVAVVAAAALMRWRYTASRPHVAGVVLPPSATVRHGFDYPEDDARRVTKRKNSPKASS